jgi:hypothetical protein
VENRLLPKDRYPFRVSQMMSQFQSLGLMLKDDMSPDMMLQSSNSTLQCNFEADSGQTGRSRTRGSQFSTLARLESQLQALTDLLPNEAQSIFTFVSNVQ